MEQQTISKSCDNINRHVIIEQQNSNVNSNATIHSGGVPLITGVTFTNTALSSIEENPKAESSHNNLPSAKSLSKSKRRQSRKVKKVKSSPCDAS